MICEQNKCTPWRIRFLLTGLFNFQQLKQDQQNKMVFSAFVPLEMVSGCWRRKINISLFASDHVSKVSSGGFPNAFDICVCCIHIVYWSSSPSTIDRQNTHKVTKTWSFESKVKKFAMFRNTRQSSTIWIAVPSHHWNYWLNWCGVFLENSNCKPICSNTQFYY